MNSSIMPAPEHRLCSSTGKRISKVDEVLLLVCARLSTCMVAQGQSPFRQKSSQNRSSRICEVWRNLGKIVSQTKKKPWRILYTQRQIILVLFLERNCSHPLALGYKKKVFLSQGQQHLESGGGDKEALKWKIENIYPKHFTQCSLFFFCCCFFIQTRVCVCFYHPNYSHQCQGDSLEQTRPKIQSLKGAKPVA